MNKKKMTAQYIELNQGFWGLIDQQGNKYEPINIPEQLKKNGKKSTVWFERIPEAQSMNMYGDIIRIEGFSVE